jgi:hypothetical protein
VGFDPHPLVTAALPVRVLPYAARRRGGDDDRGRDHDRSGLHDGDWLAHDDALLDHTPAADEGERTQHESNHDRAKHSTFSSVP